MTDTNQPDRHMQELQAYELTVSNLRAELAAERAMVVTLRETLQLLHDDVADYGRINNLGGYDNHCMKLARAALQTPAQAAQPSQPTDARERVLIEAAKLAYGHLWHINEERAAPIPFRTAERAATDARLALLGVLSIEDRREGIHHAGQLIGRFPAAIAASKGGAA